MVTCFCLTTRSVQLRSMFWILRPSSPWVCRTRLQCFATQADSYSSLQTVVRCSEDILIPIHPTPTYLMRSLTTPMLVL